MGCVGASASIGFSGGTLNSATICGFAIPPKFNFKFGFALPAIPAFPPTIPWPFIVLSCDFTNPLSAGLSGGRMPNYAAGAFDDCDTD
ncbi:MAG: hypothetical protein WC683_17360 [bacterium]